MSESIQPATTIRDVTAMVNSSAAPLFGGFASRTRVDTEIEQRYADIVSDPRYFQFAHIPGRIIQFLELCGASCDRQKTWESLRAYYLFIGVVDDEIESAGDALGKEILKRLASRLPSFDQTTKYSKACFMTEILKRYIDPARHAEVLRKFHALHRVNAGERRARTIKAFITQRKLVGRLTAELSYLLICDSFVSRDPDCCRLMKEIGAAGCLVDSIIDARADKHAGSLSFQPTVFDFLVLGFTTLRDGAKIVLKHPRMIPLFWKAARDNFADRRRSLEGHSLATTLGVQ